MSFLENIRRAKSFLEEQGRVSLRAFQREFDLDGETVGELVAELVDVQQVAAREGEVLRWIGPASGLEATAPGAALPPGTAPEAERRQLTVLFCDLVDSTRLAAGLDPENWREVVRAYQKTATEVVERFDGYVAQYLGDGLLVYFGYPQAHEDDADRAVCAGLGTVDALGDLNDLLESKHRLQLRVRIGIHTGPVVVGAVGVGEHRETLAVGETVNLAARLQAIAEADSVVISAATRRLTQGLFVIQELPARDLKGIADPVTAFRALRRRAGVRGRLDLTAAADLTPLVGRRQEIGLLRDRWDRVQEGNGQVVLIYGEPGIGKSRLVHDFMEGLAEVPHTGLECGCSPYTRDSAFRPAIELLQQGLGFAQEDSPEAKLEALERALRGAELSAPDLAPFLASLLSISHASRRVLPEFGPEGHKRKTVEALSAWLLALGERQSVVLVVEDLQWIDPSTMQLLDLLIDQIPTARILTLLTYRPEFVPPWSPRSHVTPIQLNRLTREQGTRVIEDLASGRELPRDVVDTIVSKADGVPLFVEELTKAVLESAATESPAFVIPLTLQDSLTARLDRLGPVKEVAQRCAVLGREFSYRLIRAMSPGNEEALGKALAQLVEAEFLYQRGIPPRVSYIFKHALIQEAAYHSLLKSRRRQIHEATARAIREQLPDVAETRPELLAHHYTEADAIHEAIPLWEEAGRRSAEVGAHRESIGHLRRGLRLVERLPEGPERLEQELTMQIAIGVPLQAVEGYAASEVERTFARVSELCEQADEGGRLFPAVAGLFASHLLQGQLEPARDLARRLLGMAEKEGHENLLLWARFSLGITHLYLGEFQSSRDIGEEAISLAESLTPGSLGAAYGGDPAIDCRVQVALAHWALGHPDRARSRINEAIALAEETSHRMGLVSAVVQASILHQLRGEDAEATVRAEEGIALSREGGFPFWQGVAEVIRGWAMALRGEGRRAVEEIRGGIETYRSTRAELGTTHLLALLAEAHLVADETEAAREVLSEAMERVARTGERIVESELHRLMGNLEHDRGDLVRAEGCFVEAIGVARRQNALAWELRAVMSLARQWAEQGRRDEARKRLGEIYSRFAEGFETRELEDAKALLEALE